MLSAIMGGIYIRVYKQVYMLRYIKGIYTCWIVLREKQRKIQVNRYKEFNFECSSCEMLINFR